MSTRTFPAAALGWVAVLSFVTGCGQLGPKVTALSPQPCEVERVLKIEGENFGVAPAVKVVTLNGKPATSVLSWSDTSIVILVPPGAAARGEVKIKVDELESNGVPCAVKAPPPALTDADPALASIGTLVKLTGKNLGTVSGRVYFGAKETTARSWTDTAVEVEVPEGAETGTIQVKVDGQSSNPVSFELAVPAISELEPECPRIGGTLTIVGHRFGADAARGKVLLGETPATVVTWTDKKIQVTVPDMNERPAVEVKVVVAGVQSRAKRLELPRPPGAGEIAEAGSAGEFQSIALDADGFPVIASVSAQDGHPILMTWTGLNWKENTWEDPSFLTGDVLHMVGYANVLATDASGTAHVAALDFFDCGIVYMTRTAAGVTKVQRIVKATPNRDVFSIGMALDSKGMPRVSLFTERQGLKLYVPSGATWTEQILDPRGGEGEVSAPPVLRYDGSGRLHMAFYEAKSQSLMHGLLTGTSWKFTVVDPGPKVGDGLSMVLDANQNPTFAYRDFSGTGALKVALPTGPGLWKPVTVDVSPGSARQTTMAYDSKGTLWIYYSGATSRFEEGEFQGRRFRKEIVTPRALSMATLEGGAWKKKSLEDAPGAWRPSLVIDKKGRKLVAYSEKDATRLKLHITP